MKASEFLNEASIIDKLKGVFKKKTPPSGSVSQSTALVPQNQPQDVTDVNPKYVKPRQQPKLGYNQTTVPKAKPRRMKVSKVNPKTAIGTKNKGGSPEYQAAQAELQKNKETQATTQQPPSKPARQRDARGRFAGAASQAAPMANTPAAVNPASSFSDIKANVQQKEYERRMAKAIASNIQGINNPELLAGIRSVLDQKLGPRTKK